MEKHVERTSPETLFARGTRGAPVASETELAYLFAGLLAISAVILLFLPLVRHVRLFSESRLLSWLVAIAILAVGLGAVALVLLAISEPAYSLPVLAVTAALRIASPTLLQRKVRDRFETARAWPVLRFLVAAVYLSLAGLLLYELALLVSVGRPPGPAVLSEQLVMALGASTLLVRFALRARPRDQERLWPVWLAAILFAVAFVVVAPYAFPAFAVAYLASGLVGWILGVVAIRYDW